MDENPDVRQHVSHWEHEATAAEKVLLVIEGKENVCDNVRGSASLSNETSGWKLDY
jgi:hypothetical protein